MSGQSGFPGKSHNDTLLMAKCPSREEGRLAHEDSTAVNAIVMVSSCIDRGTLSPR